MRRLAALLEEGVRDGIFPSAQAVVLHRGERVFDHAAGDARPSTLFDLASLTKVICTTAVFASLWKDGIVAPSAPVSRWLSETPASDATLEDLLRHRAGLPPSPLAVAFALARWPQLLTSPDTELRREVRDAVIEHIAAISPVAPIGKEAVYSDVGFILLGEALARAARVSLERLYVTRVAEPLGLGCHFRRLSSPPPPADVAPSGRTRPREPPPGVADPLPAGVERVSSPPGEVDDDTCWVMDGVAGHAGLFGTAGDVAKFGQAVLDDYEGATVLAPPELWQKIATPDGSTPGSTRAIGFDTPSAQGSSAGAAIGREPPGAIGHLGFTGTSLWIDLSRKLVVALVTNRTYLGRAEVRIKDFRPRFHDAVVEALPHG